MMDWMHKFNPLPDTVDRQMAKKYLESEMERIKKVKEQMNKSIENAKMELEKINEESENQPTDKK
jgi:hypothetical protein